VTRVLLLEPYFAGSHRAWAEGFRAASGLEVELMTLPGRFWKWRMHGAAVTFARRLNRRGGPKPDVLVATDMLDLAALLGLARDALGGVPAALYVHENQLAYPKAAPDPDWTPSRRRRAARPEAHYAFVNLSSALAADRVWWNSRHNRDSFLEALPGFLGAFPDFRERGAPAAVAARSEVLPLGLDLGALAAARPPERPPGPPRIVWNHRWEHDKDPEAFVRAVDVLAARGLDFEVILLGERFGRAPSALDRLRAGLGTRVVHAGHVADRTDYARWLWSGDVVVSTARHDFFGAAVCEAVFCGCLPVLPRGLAYPELIPEPWQAAALYDDFDGLVERLARDVTSPDEGARQALAHAMGAYDWARMAPEYDARLRALSAGARESTGWYSSLP